MLTSKMRVEVEVEEEEEEDDYSPTSSIDSSSSLLSAGRPNTDLRLGIPSSNTSSSLNHQTQPQPQPQLREWPPIKPLLRSILANYSSTTTLYVKVYMEGIPIGRKLDLLAHHGYQQLTHKLSSMFRTTILLWPDVVELEGAAAAANANVLTYEDKEGDWMMVGDVPWEMFLSSVKKLKISRADKC